MMAFLPANIEIAGYKFHKSTFRSSPTPAKKDRNGYAKDLSGYVKPIGENLIDIYF